MVLRNSILLITFAVLFANCGGDGNVIAFVGATIIDGTGAEPINDAVMIVRDGRIETIGPDGSVDIPSNAERVDLAGRTVMPGLINTHGHVGDTRGLETGHYSEENVLRQLALYARYGVTTVNSLGGDGPEGIRVRDAQNTPTLNRARLYAAGAVVTGDTPDAARQIVEENAAMNVDFIKIRVDDNLGTASKMTPEVFSAVIEAAHDRGLRVASHVYYLEDAKALDDEGIEFGILPPLPDRKDS